MLVPEPSRKTASWIPRVLQSPEGIIAYTKAQPEPARQFEVVLQKTEELIVAVRSVHVGLRQLRRCLRQGLPALGKPTSLGSPNRKLTTLPN